MLCKRVFTLWEINITSVPAQNAIKSPAQYCQMPKLLPATTSTLIFKSITKIKRALMTFVNIAILLPSKVAHITAKNANGRDSGLRYLPRRKDATTDRSRRRNSSKSLTTLQSISLHSKTRYPYISAERKTSAEATKIMLYGWLLMKSIPLKP